MLQIGITSIGVLSGIVGEAVLAVPLADWLTRFGVQRDTGLVAATVLVVMVITYVSIVIGELVPKRLGQIDPEGIARLVARPMNALATAAHPFVWLLSWPTAAILRLLGQADLGAPRVTEDEIHALLQEGSEAGVIEPSEHHMVRNVFRLDDRHDLCHRRIWRCPRPGDPAGPDRGGHRGVSAAQRRGRLGHPPRGRLLAPGRPDPSAGTQGPARSQGGSEGGEGPLQHWKTPRRGGASLPR